MNCPACQHQDTKVIDSRESENGLAIRRRRECEACDFRFTTLERIEVLNLEVVKKSGGLRTVPQIFIDDYHVGGYDDLAALDDNGELERLLDL